MLTALKDVVAHARPAGLQAIRTTIAGAINAAHQSAQRSHEAATGAIREVATVDVSGAAMQRELQSFQADFYGRHIFDRYLRFTSKEDEEAYRRREEENRRYIEAQLATKTPEGRLNAAGAAIDQMLDAHAHGAGESPEFAARWTRLLETTRRHRDAVRELGQDTGKFDRRVSASVRRFLKDKGLGEPEIDAAIARAPHPLEAVRPYVKTDEEALSLMRGAGTESRPIFDDGTQGQIAKVIDTNPPREGLATKDFNPSWLDSVAAKLRAAGVLPSEPSPDRPVNATKRDAQHRPGQQGLPR